MKQRELWQKNVGRKFFLKEIFLAPFFCHLRGLRRLALLAVFVNVGAIMQSVFAGDPTPDQLNFFENKIRPIFADNCYKCHSATAEKVKGGSVA